MAGWSTLRTCYRSATPIGGHTGSLEADPDAGSSTPTAGLCNLQTSVADSLVALTYDIAMLEVALKADPFCSKLAFLRWAKSTHGGRRPTTDLPRLALAGAKPCRGHLGQSQGVKDNEKVGLSSVALS